MNLKKVYRLYREEADGAQAWWPQARAWDASAYGDPQELN
jgi:hypothetical protein